MGASNPNQRSKKKQKSKKKKNKLSLGDRQLLGDGPQSATGHILRKRWQRHRQDYANASKRESKIDGLSAISPLKSLDSMPSGDEDSAPPTNGDLANLDEKSPPSLNDKGKSPAIQHLNAASQKNSVTKSKAEELSNDGFRRLSGDGDPALKLGKSFWMYISDDVDAARNSAKTKTSAGFVAMPKGLDLSRKLRIVHSVWHLGSSVAVVAGHTRSGRGMRELPHGSELQKKYIRVLQKDIDYDHLEGGRGPHEPLYLAKGAAKAESMIKLKVILLDKETLWLKEDNAELDPESLLRLLKHCNQIEQIPSIEQIRSLHLCEAPDRLRSASPPRDRGDQFNYRNRSQVSTHRHFNSSMSESRSRNVQRAFPPTYDSYRPTYGNGLYDSYRPVYGDEEDRYSVRSEDPRGRSRSRGRDHAQREHYAEGGNRERVTSISQVEQNQPALPAEHDHSGSHLTGAQALLVQQGPSDGTSRRDSLLATSPSHQRFQHARVAEAPSKIAALLSIDNMPDEEQDVQPTIDAALQGTTTTPGHYDEAMQPTNSLPTGATALFRKTHIQNCQTTDEEEPTKDETAT